MKIIPFGDRILVRRRKVGQKLGSGILYAADTTADTKTELADVVHVPELTAGDKAILDKSDRIIGSLTEKASHGDDKALIALLRINEFVKMKSIKVGDSIFMGKYVGTDFHDSENPEEELTLVRESDIIGLVVE